jgi:hypothetical protein
MLRRNIKSGLIHLHPARFAQAWVFHCIPDTVMPFDPADDIIDAD